MTLDHFVKQINGELSQDCQIPFQISKKSLMRTIEWAQKWFWKNYEYAVEEVYIYVQDFMYSTEEFKRDRSITLCDEIVDVHGVWRIGGGSLVGDFSFQRLMQQDILQLRNMLGSSAFHLDYYVVGQTYYDAMRQLLDYPVSFDYNPNNKKFRLQGEIPAASLVLQVNRGLEIESLCEDEIFFRYIMAQVKINLARIMGTITMPLVGNAEINFSDLKSDGQDELQAIKEEIKENEGADYFFST